MPHLHFDQNARVHEGGNHRKTMSTTCFACFQSQHTMLQNRLGLTLLLVSFLFFSFFLLCIHRVDEQTNVITNVRIFGLHCFACLFIFPFLSDFFFGSASISASWSSAFLCRLTNPSLLLTEFTKTSNSCWPQVRPSCDFVTIVTRTTTHTHTTKEKKERKIDRETKGNLDDLQDRKKKIWLQGFSLSPFGVAVHPPPPPAPLPTQKKKPHK